MAGPTINTKIKLDGEAEYKQAVKEINAALGNLDSKLKNLDETYKDSEGSVEGLTKKNEVLNQKILTQKEKSTSCGKWCRAPENRSVSIPRQHKITRNS